MGKAATESMKASDAKKAAIEADIARTRDDMSRTVDAIEERLSPAHIKEQIADVKTAAIDQYHEAKDHVKADLSQEIAEAKLRVQEEVQHAKRMLQMEMRDAKRAVREATVGKVQHMARDARTGIMDTIRENPVPSAMIALGIGWLLMGGGKKTTRRDDIRVRQYRGYDDGYEFGAPHGVYEREDDDYEIEARSLGRRVRRGAEGAIHTVQDRAGQVVDRAGNVLHDATDAASQAARRAGEGIGHLTDDARDAAANLASSTRNAASHLASDARVMSRRAIRTAGRQFERAESGIESTLRDNPLAVGAVALAVGAAVGLALPHTEREDQLLGQAKDRLLEKAQDFAQDAVQNASQRVEQLTTQIEEKVDAKLEQKPNKQMPRQSNPNIS
jgi:hypothetical protein